MVIKLGSEISHYSTFWYEMALLMASNVLVLDGWLKIDEAFNSGFDDAMTTDDRRSLLSSEGRAGGGHLAS